MAWSWYLQADFQLYLFGLLIMFIYKRNAKIAYGIMLICFLFPMAYTFYLAQSRNLLVKVFVPDYRTPSSGDYHYMINIKPWTRCSSYIIGMVFGIQYVKHFYGLTKKTTAASASKDILNQANREDSVANDSTQR